MLRESPRGRSLPPLPTPGPDATALQIKKALKAPPGAFRATFEDKILISGARARRARVVAAPALTLASRLADLVFCRTWVPVAPKRFFAVVTNHLEPGNEWSGVRTVREIRAERQIPVPVQKDSLYAVRGGAGQQR